MVVLETLRSAAACWTERAVIEVMQSLCGQMKIGWKARKRGDSRGAEYRLISEMQKSLDAEDRSLQRHIEAVANATIKRERAEAKQVKAVHAARHAGVTWVAIAGVASKGSAAAAASFFGDSMADREMKRIAARERAARRSSVTQT